MTASAHEFIFTSASADVSTWSKLPLGPGAGPPGSGGVGSEIASLSAHTSANTATTPATIGLALVETSATTHKIVKYHTYTVTTLSTARRTNYANNANDYMASVACDSPTTWADKLDLNGHGIPVTDSSGVTRTGGATLEWRIGLVTAGTLGTVTALVFITRVT